MIWQKRENVSLDAVGDCMTRRVTVKDIASKMGISLSTVNKALTGKPGVSEERRAEVIAVAREMGYVVNHVAQSLSRKPIHIGIVIPSDWQQYFASVEYGMQVQLGKLAQSNVHGTLLHVGSKEDIPAAFERLYRDKADIILYCPSLYELPENFGGYVAGKGVPVFVVGNDCDSLDSACTVSVDAKLAGSMAADFLRSMLPPGSKVAVFTGSRDMSAHMDKANAFLDRARELGLNPVGMYETFDNAEIVVQSLDKMQAEYPDVSGIFVATGITRPVVDYFNRENTGKCPCLVATDLYDGIREDMENRLVQGTIFQNQVLMGRLAVKMAYRYVVGITSYNTSGNDFSDRINVLPQLFLASNVKNFTLDDGNDYTLA